jgi:hypothetical protein
MLAECEAFVRTIAEVWLAGARAPAPTGVAARTRRSIRSRRAGAQGGGAAGARGGSAREDAGGRALTPTGKCNVQVTKLVAFQLPPHL